MNNSDKHMKFALKEIILTAAFAALTAILSQISIAIPFSPVPLTMQLFAVYLAGIILGSKYGALSQMVYLIVGLAGMPVFANFESGLATLLGPKGGYLASFPIMAFVTGYAIERSKTLSAAKIVGICLPGLLICYFLGVTWLSRYLGNNIAKAIMAGAVPFIPFDLLKAVISGFLGLRIRTALDAAGLLPVKQR